MASSSEIVSVQLTGNRHETVSVRHDEQTGQHVLDMRGRGDEQASAAQPLGTREQAISMMQQRIDQIRQGAMGEGVGVEIVNDGGGLIA